MSCLFLPTLPHRKRELRHGVHEVLLNCADFEKHDITQLEFNVSLFVHMSLVFDEFLMSCVVHFFCPLSRSPETRVRNEFL